MSLQYLKDPEMLESLAYDYVQDCEGYHTEKLANNGQVVKLKDRKIPTIKYFLMVWIPSRGAPLVSRNTYYRWIREKGDDAVIFKGIKDLFDAVAIDIIANDNKGAGAIFYGKQIGMTDRPDPERTNFTPAVVQITGMQII